MSLRNAPNSDLIIVVLKIGNRSVSMTFDGFVEGNVADLDVISN